MDEVGDSGLVDGAQVGVAAVLVALEAEVSGVADPAHGGRITL